MSKSKGKTQSFSGHSIHQEEEGLEVVGVAIGLKQNTSPVTPGDHGKTTRRQALGELGEKLVALSIPCQVCDSGAYSLLPRNTKSVDLVCKSCNSFAQVKTVTTKSGLLPKQILGGAWNPQMLLIHSGRLPDLFIVLVRQGSPCEVFHLPAGEQPASIFVPRKPLSHKAKSPGWIGFTIRLDLLPKNPKSLGFFWP
jgi:hypothetical protein